MEIIAYFLVGIAVTILIEIIHRLFPPDESDAYDEIPERYIIYSVTLIFWPVWVALICSGLVFHAMTEGMKFFKSMWPKF